MSTRDVVEKIIRGILIVLVGIFVLAGLVLGACFLML